MSLDKKKPDFQGWVNQRDFYKTKKIYQLYDKSYYLKKSESSSILKILTNLFSHELKL